MGDGLSIDGQKVQDALTARGSNARVVELPHTTHSAGEAAEAIGCQLGQICKSLVFTGQTSGNAILILVSGSNRVDENLISAWLGEPVVKASARFVKEQTGFIVGGVPPLGHIRPLKTLIDRDLFQYREIWAAGGTANAVFKLTPGDLLALTGGTMLTIHL